MSIVAFALKRPYSILAVLILVTLLGVGAALRMPVDIFPEIDIPVVSVVWTYNGMSAEDMQNRILVLHERQLASLVDNIERIESNSYEGVGVIKVYLHEGADVTRAVAQLAAVPLVVLKYMPRNITPPLILRVWGDGCADYSAQRFQQFAVRYTTERSGAERHPAGFGRGARGIRSLSVRRKAAGDHGGSE